MRVVVAVLLFLNAILNASIAQAMNLQELAACRKQVLELEYKYLEWKNPVPKPGLNAIISDEQILQQAEDAIRMRRLLETQFGIRLSAQMLQGELDRIAANTRAPERLEEVFATLDQNPDRIAACFVLPDFVKRKLQTAFQFAPSIHGTLRQEIEAQRTDPQKMTDSVLPFNEFERIFQRVERPSKLFPDPHFIEMTADNFEATRGESRAKSQILQENELSFYSITVIEEHSDRMVLRTREWLKKSFDVWWLDQRAGIELPETPPKFAAALVLPEITGQGASNQTYPADSWRSPALPTARSRHAAVWTGTEMVIWGGNSLQGTVNSGGRYNPVTDTWRPTSLVNAPSARRDFSMVWSGTEMIVWGGASQSSGQIGDGARYNPVSDTWATMSTLGAPSPRQGAPAVWTGTEMILWGGSSFQASIIDGGARYNPNTNTWQSISTTGGPGALFGHHAIWTGSEMLILSTNSPARRYAPNSDTWRSMAAWPNRRSSTTAVWTGSELLIWGGNPAPALERYRPDTDSWSTGTTTNAPTADLGHTAVWSGSEMLVWGGCLSPSSCAPRPGAKYNPSTNQWGEMDFITPPLPRSGHTSVWTGNEMIVWGGGLFLSFGGVGSGEPYSDGARYNPQLNQWIPTALPSTGEPEPRSNHTATWTGNEMVIWGGVAQANGSQAISKKRYNPLLDSWRGVSDVGAPTTRFDHSAIWTGSEMIVWGGGSNSSSGYHRNGGHYNPITDTWRLIVPSMPPAPPDNTPAGRIRHAAVWSGQEMIIWGGSLNTGDTNSGGRYRPTSGPLTGSWQPMSTNNAPSARVSPPAVWTGSEMIIWGGCQTECPQRTGGRYQPASDAWSTMPILGSPRDDGSDGVRLLWTGSEVLASVGSGFPPSFPPADTRRFSPGDSSWRPTRTSSCRSFPDFGFSAVWTGTELISFGGGSNGPVTLAATRQGSRYDPTLDRWRRIDSVNAPEARSGHTSVWTGREMLVFGGVGYFGQRRTAEFAIYYPYGVWGGFANGFESAQPDPCDAP